MDLNEEALEYANKFFETEEMSFSKLGFIKGYTESAKHSKHVQAKIIQAQIATIKLVSKTSRDDWSIALSIKLVKLKQQLEKLSE